MSEIRAGSFTNFTTVFCRIELNRRYVKSLSFFILTMSLMLFSGIAGAESPYGKMDVYYNDRLLPGSEVAKPVSKIGEPFSVRVDVTLYQESKLYIKLTVIDKTHFEFIDGPADIDQLTSHIFETNETYTFEWILKPTDVCAGNSIPVNIHYSIFLPGVTGGVVEGGFTIAYPHISNEHYDDKTPPFISNIIINNLINDSVTISWDTDKDSNSVVKYGTTSGDYKNVEYDTALVSSHSISPGGLSASTTYYFVVNSTDASGNSDESSEYNFTTATIATPDVILNDNGRSRVSGTNVTVLNATVIDSGSGVMNVTIDLSSIGGLDAQVMERIDGTDVWTVATNAVDGINLTHELVVTATDVANNTNTSVIELTVLLRGDVVRDGNLNSADVLYIAKYLVGKESMPSLLVGDMFPDTGDGMITSADALYLAKSLVGKEAAP